MRRYALLDTPREDSFDRLVRLAARVMGTPIAAISLVDVDRSWFKAEVGLGAREVPRRLALCNRTIGSVAAFYELPDTHADPTLAGNPLLDLPTGMRFYAGAALVTPDGFRIGALSVIDRRPRPALTAEQRTTLADLAGTVMTELERRRQQILRQATGARLALINNVLAEAGGAAGFVAAIEAAITRLCRHTGAINGQLWATGAGPALRALAFATDGPMTAERRAAFFRMFADGSRTGRRPRLPHEGRRLMVPEITPERAARWPLMRYAYDRGVRAFLLQPLTVGSERFGLVLTFGTPRQDLPELAELLAEVGQAIRPALLRKQAEERLALLNDVLAAIAGAPNFLAGVEGAIALLCRHTGAWFGQLWDRADDGAAIRLVALAGAAPLPADLRGQAFATFPTATDACLLAPLIATGGRLALPHIPHDLAAKHPLLQAVVDIGLRSLAAQAFAVADARYTLILGFATERGDLDAVTDMLGEMAQAIRPAVLRKRAEDRLALINDVLASVAGASGFRVAIEAVLERFNAHTGALWGLIWEKADTVDELRLTGARGGPNAPPGFPAVAAAAFPMAASDSLLAPLLETEGSRVVAVLTDEMAARHPLIRVGREAGMRSFAAQSLVVGGHRYVLCFTFDRERQDLEQTAALLAEIGHAIRPALQRKQAEERLAALQQSLQDRTADLTELARLARIGSWSWHAEDNRVEWSDETYGLFGVTQAGFAPTVAGFLRLLHPEDAVRARATGRHAIRHGQDLHAEVRVPIAGARTRSIVWSGTARRGPTGSAVELRGYCQDVTDQREAEAALRHGEKLRALGKLTGGIAHEFNNLLTVVQANLSLALDETENLADARPELEAAQRAVLAGTELTARLLSVARSEPLRREATDLAALLGPLLDMATRTLGSRYRLLLTTDPDLPPISVDRSQLEGAVLNLILNARDAMAMGGPIAIETGRLSVPPAARGAWADLRPGTYAAIAVRDLGTGMAPEVAERAFEPFFTTKAAGSGTGLGLSMVLSFARQSGGTALIVTDQGCGTTVRIVLPLA